MTTANPETSTTATQSDTGTVAPATGDDWVTVVPVPLPQDQAEAIRTRADLDSLTHGPGRVAAYVSSDGRTLTTWSGGELARVIDHRRGRRSDWWKFERGCHTFYGFNAGPGSSVMVRAYSTPAKPPAVIPKPDDDELPPREHP
ncbi:hypothetical protein ACFXG4_30485 [Nocardia sp. NPDC059246]|uniref:hypothetical protein n=1 Tax=unclassified Nocardia TaxID=2637762 RepID=UPI0036C707B4